MACYDNRIRRRLKEPKTGVGLLRMQKKEPFYEKTR
jgi:hypothetical protein